MWIIACSELQPGKHGAGHAQGASAYPVAQYPAQPAYGTAAYPANPAYPAAPPYPAAPGGFPVAPGGYPPHAGGYPPSGQHAVYAQATPSGYPPAGYPPSGYAADTGAPCHATAPSYIQPGAPIHAPNPHGYPGHGIAPPCLEGDNYILHLLKQWAVK